MYVCVCVYIQTRIHVHKYMHILTELLLLKEADCDKIIKKIVFIILSNRF